MIRLTLLVLLVMPLLVVARGITGDSTALGQRVFPQERPYLARPTHLELSRFQVLPGGSLLLNLSPPVTLYQVRGTSMEPCLGSGAIVVTVRQKPILGDVVAARWGSASVVLHQVVALGQDEQGAWYRLQGMNLTTNFSDDGTLYRDSDILGVAVLW